jgi:hypothetical protein
MHLTLQEVSTYLVTSARGLSVALTVLNLASPTMEKSAALGKEAESVASTHRRRFFSPPARSFSTCSSDHTR